MEKMGDVLSTKFNTHENIKIMKLFSMHCNEF